MFLSLLGVTFIISAVVCTIVARVFSRPVNRIMQRIVPDDIGGAWVRYLTFAIYVVGISGGVRIHQLERYISPIRDQQMLTLTGERWIIEVYGAIVGTLQSIAWMLLVFFIFALIAYVIVRIFEMKRGSGSFNASDDT